MDQAGSRGKGSIPRFFFTLNVPKPLRRRLMEIPQTWAERDRRHWRWVEPRLLHMTLAFLGERSEAELKTILQVGKEAAAKASPFELRCRGLGAFPSVGKPTRVLWAGLDPSTPLSSLVDDLVRGLLAAGTAVETKPFSAHVTLARRRKGHERGAPPLPEALSGQDWGRWIVDELILMESHLGNGPPTYNHRATWRL